MAKETRAGDEFWFLKLNFVCVGVMEEMDESWLKMNAI